MDPSLYGIDYLVCALGGRVLDESDSVFKNAAEKKQRDEVRYERGVLPWRRAPVWATIRQLAHVVCCQVRESSPDENYRMKKELIYKLFIQRFLSFSLEMVVKNSPLLVSLSSLYEAAKKLVRRQVKIHKPLQHKPQMREIFGEVLLNPSLASVKSAKDHAMNMVQVDWKQVCHQENKIKLDCQLIITEYPKATTHILETSGKVLGRIAESGTNFYLEKQRMETKNQKNSCSQQMLIWLLLAYQRMLLLNN